MATPPALVALLKACARQKDLSEGSRLHAAIIQKQLLTDNLFIGNALVNMYAKCGAFFKAQQVFHALPMRDIFSWTPLILAYAQDGHGKQALSCFDRMACEGVSPDAVAFSAFLKACGIIGASKKGKEIHAVVEGEGLLQNDTALGNALLDMYVKCGCVSNAQEVFDRLASRDVISWTALIAGYCQNGEPEKAIRYFEQMSREGLHPNEMTFSCALKACASIGAVAKGIDIHDEIVREGLLASNSVLGTALLDMYVKCGALSKAQEVFNALRVQDKVSWTSLIAGYSQHGHGEEAMDCFSEMLCKGLHADVVAFGSVLKACGTTGAAEKGRKIHAEILKEGLVCQDIKLGNALVDMYAKCGTVTKAQQIFYELPIRDVASWTALIAGYMQVGKHSAVFESFNKSVQQGIEPDSVLFNVLLNACRCFGLVDEGRVYFEIVSASYCIIPTLEHYSCMVELYGRVGQLEKAVALIKKMPSSDLIPAWFAFLGACKKWGNTRLGRLAFENAVKQVAA